MMCPFFTHLLFLQDWATPTMAPRARIETGCGIQTQGFMSQVQLFSFPRICKCTLVCVYIYIYIYTISEHYKHDTYIYAYSHKTIDTNNLILYNIFFVLYILYVYNTYLVTHITIQLMSIYILGVVIKRASLKRWDVHTTWTRNLIVGTWKIAYHQRLCWLVYMLACWIYCVS